MTEIPYDELDQNIVEITRFLNSFDGIYTVGSCGGHPNPEKWQLPEGDWNVLFCVEFDELNGVNPNGWFALEFLVWACGDLRRGGLGAYIFPHSAPPYLNYPGSTLNFSLEARGSEDDSGDVSPANILKWLSEFKDECFISYEEYLNETVDDEDSE